MNEQKHSDTFRATYEQISAWVWNDRVGIALNNPLSAILTLIVTEQCYHCKNKISCDIRSLGLTIINIDFHDYKIICKNCSREHAKNGDTPLANGCTVNFLAHAARKAVALNDQIGHIRNAFFSVVQLVEIMKCYICGKKTNYSLDNIALLVKHSGKLCYPTQTYFCKQCMPNCGETICTVFEKDDYTFVFKNQLQKHYFDRYLERKDDRCYLLSSA
jgi:hypothetical protein